MEMLFSVSLFLFEIPTGVVADKWGRKASPCPGTLLLGGSFAALGIIHSIIPFIIIQVVSACGFSMISGADRALGMVFVITGACIIAAGIVSAGFNAGGMLLLFANGFINARLGTKNTLFLSSVIPGALYVLLFLFPHTRPVVFAAIFGITMLRSFRAPLLTTLMNTQIANENRATVLSGIPMVERIIISLFYPGAGMLMDFSARWTYLIAGIATLFISLLLRIGKTK